MWYKRETIKIGCYSSLNFLTNTNEDGSNTKNEVENNKKNEAENNTKNEDESI